MEMERHGNLAGGSVLAFPLPIEVTGMGHDRWSQKPVGQLAAQPWRTGQAQAGGTVVGLDERSSGSGHVAPVTVDHVDPLKAMAGQGNHHVPQHSQQGAGLEADGARKSQVMFGHAKRLGRGHQHMASLRHGLGHGIRCEGIRANGSRGAVLLGRPQGQDHAFVVLQIGLHLGPCPKLESPALGFKGNSRCRHGLSGSAMALNCL